MHFLLQAINRGCRKKFFSHDRLYQGHPLPEFWSPIFEKAWFQLPLLFLLPCHTDIQISLPASIKYCLFQKTKVREQVIQIMDLADGLHLHYNFQADTI